MSYQGFTVVFIVIVTTVWSSGCNFICFYWMSDGHVYISLPDVLLPKSKLVKEFIKIQKCCIYGRIWTMGFGKKYVIIEIILL